MARKKATKKKAVHKKVARKKATRKRPAKKKPPLTIEVIAEGVGVSTTTIDKYVKLGCPRHSIEAAQEWRSNNIKAVADSADVSELGIENKRAEIAERNENARTRKLKNDLLEGRLAYKDDIERQLTTALSRMVNRLNSLGTMCANFCPSAVKSVVKQAVEGVVTVMLQELSNDIARME